MTPEVFAARMHAIAEKHAGDTEYQHAAGDDLMLELLCSLGYQEGCEVFGAWIKWYA